MAAFFEFMEDNGAAGGTPPTGTDSRAVVTNVNWKNIDDNSTAYTSSPITAGSNSYDKWQFGRFTGSFNEISAVLFQHTTGDLNANITISGGIGKEYTTPSTTLNSSLDFDLSSTGLIANGTGILLGPTGPEHTGAGGIDKVAATGANPCYTQYITTQLVTTASAPAGDLTETVQFTLQYNEN